MLKSTRSWFEVKENSTLQRVFYVVSNQSYYKHTHPECNPVGFGIIEVIELTIFSGLLEKAGPRELEQFTGGLRLSGNPCPLRCPLPLEMAFPCERHCHSIICRIPGEATFPILVRTADLSVLQAQTFGANFSLLFLDSTISEAYASE